MDKHRFERAIKLGLGRIILYLKQHDAMPYRDIILDCCLHNISYDSQLEGFKTNYIADVIALTGETEFYREHIMKRAYAIDLPKIDPSKKDERHILYLVHQFALRGDLGARQFVYDAFQEYLPQQDTFFAWQIIEIDKVDGFLHVLAHTNYDEYENDTLLWLLEDDIGELEAQEKLQDIRLKNQQLDDALKRITAHRIRHKQLQPQRLQSYKQRSQTTLRSLIDNEAPPHIFRQWAQHASQQNLLDAAHDLLKITDKDLLLKYLRIFWDIPFPLEPGLLFHLTEHDEFRVMSNIFMVLRNSQDHAVRDLALRLIEEGKHENRAIDLLVLNYQKSDWKLIEDVVQRTHDIDKFHSIQFSVSRKIFRQNPRKEAKNTLLYLYEHAPCSDCRYYILQNLQSIDELTDAIKEECFYDSNEDIREWAKNGFVDGTQ